MCIEINVFFQVTMAGVAAVKAKILAGQVVGLQEDVKVSWNLSSVNISNIDTSPLSAGLKVLRQLVFCSRIWLKLRPRVAWSVYRCLYSKV